MRVKLDKSFVRDVKKLTDKKLRNRLADYIEFLTAVKTIKEIQNIKKLKFQVIFIAFDLGSIVLV